MTPRPVSLLSDYGLDDEFVAVCKGVILQILPDVKLLDVTHMVPRHDVRCGALTLTRAIQYLPSGVHVAVVDPGVGTDRKAIAVRSADDRIFVGPDNGLLGPAVQVCGGAVEAVALDSRRWGMESPSATFHGRDVFAPAAAALAGGVPMGELGDPVDPAGLVPMLLPLCQRKDDGSIAAMVLWVDRFGNCATNISEVDLAEAGIDQGDILEVDVRERRERIPFVATYSEVDDGRFLAAIDSAGQLAVAVARGSAADDLGLASGDPLSVRKAESL